jgi:glutathione S-transferase
MKLYWGPHTCAIGIHILLEEIGEPYATEKLNVSEGATQAPEFLAINPKGKVPTLIRNDGSVLTEFGAISTWLARTHPAARLLPEDPDAQARAMELLEYVEGTVHGQGFGRIFKPQRFEPQDTLHGTVGLGQANVRRQGVDMVRKAFAIIDSQLRGTEYALGEFSIADAALFYVERWAPQQDINLPSNIEAHFRRMLNRPSVKTVRAIWGET